jgi:hypothetical protein
MIEGMTTPIFDVEQKQVHVALSSFVSSMIHSTEIRNVVVNLPEIVSDENAEPRKYRPGPGGSPVAPLDLSI